MKTVVYGAGSIGCYIGAILHKQGSDVCLLGRERIKKLIDEADGIHISDYEGRDDLVQNVPFATSPDVLTDADIILVTLKCTAIDSAIAELTLYASKSALIICMQNGIGAAEKVKQALPEHQIYTGITPFNVVQGSNSEKSQSENFHSVTFHQTTFRRATEGELHLPNLPQLQSLASAWSQYGLGCDLNDDIDAVVWGKLLLNLNNAINAISDIPLKSQLEQRGYRMVLAQCQKELLNYCAASGIELAKLTAVKPAMLPVILRLPDWLFKRIAQKMLAIDPKARSSMWEDVTTGRKTEIDFLNGAVARLSESIGLAAPANKTVANLVRQTEAGELSPGISAAELYKRVG